MNNAEQRELSVLAVFRVHKWLFDLRKTVEAIRNDAKQTKSVRTIAQHCSGTADRLLALLKSTTADTTHNAQFVVQAIELAAELAGEWHSINSHMSVEAPLGKYLAIAGTGKANTTKSNAEKKNAADQKAITAFEQWAKKSSLHDSLAKLTRPEQVKKYLKVGRPPDRTARRLRAMLRASRIK